MLEVLRMAFVLGNINVEVKIHELTIIPRWA